MKILLLNGANMNMLGRRDPELYGTQTLAQLEKEVSLYALEKGMDTVCMHSNSEGQLTDILQQTDCDGVIFNAGAYSHYSYVLRDCIECMSIPVAEVHMTDVSAREEFRRRDVLAEVCSARFMGRGVRSYLDAVDWLSERLNGQ